MAPSTNDLYYTTPEQAVFSVRLPIKDGKDFAAGVIALKDNRAISASVSGKAIAWARDIGVDIVDFSEEKVVLFVAVAPSTAKAPSASADFWNVPGRSIAVCSKEIAHASARPMMSSALSYKVKGQTPEEMPLAVLIVGVRTSSAVKGDRHFDLGFRCGLTSTDPGSGQSDGVSVTADTS